MMFDEAQVFKGLLAWFSASVPTRLRSQWVTNGGIQSNDFHDADYIFSSNAAAKDILRIFDSETYQKEELTIFHSSLIEDTLTNGKSCLSGRYAGAYILIHPAYQKEIESFHKEQCWQSNVKRTKNEDGTERYPNTSSSYRDKFESFITQQQIMEGEPSDEWDFGDDSNLPKKDARKGCEAIVQSDRSNEMLHDSSLTNSNPAALKQLSLERPPNREQELTLLKFARKGTNNSCLGESQEKRFCGNHSQNLMDLESEQDLCCGEYQRKSESDFQGVKERESLLSDSQLKNKATLETPKSCSMSQFLSSMDDGFVHIDDIKLPDSPIYDFIPNQNGCQVEPK